MNISLEKNSKIPLYRQLYDQVRKMILHGELAEGSILPSERMMAKLAGTHRNTVSKAYSELKADGLVTAEHGIGYRVGLGEGIKKRVSGRGTRGGTKSTLLSEVRTASAGSHAEKRNAVPQKSKAKKKKVNWVNMVKDEYLDMEVTFDDLFQRFRDKDVISMGTGISTPGIYDKDMVGEDVSKIITGEGKTQYFYSPYRGDEGLRRQIVSFLRTKGIDATTGQIQILTETNQALDFIVTLMIKAGDTVIMEEPVSPDAYRAMELAGAHIVTVPTDEDGVDCEAVERIVKSAHPKLIYVNSSFHDPTGSILSAERRRRLIEISNEYRLPIVEEDAASELVYRGEKLPPIKSLDACSNVIYIYSFSLTFVPGLSLAFVVADSQLIRSLSYLVSVRMIAIDWMCQKLLSKYMSDGTYYRTLEIYKTQYREKQELVCRKLDDLRDRGVGYMKPRGGVYIWCRLPKGVDSKAFVAKAYGEGLSLLPGYIFFKKRSGGRDYVRINYSFESKERLAVGMDIFSRVLDRFLSGDGKACTDG